jgi:hypothetical protein
MPAGDDEAQSDKNENLVEKGEHSELSADDEDSVGSAFSFLGFAPVGFFANVCASI